MAGHPAPISVSQISKTQPPGPASSKINNPQPWDPPRPRKKSPPRPLGAMRSRVICTPQSNHGPSQLQLGSLARAFAFSLFCFGQISRLRSYASLLLTSWLKSKVTSRPRKKSRARVRGLRLRGRPSASAPGHLQTGAQSPPAAYLYVRQHRRPSHARLARTTSYVFLHHRRVDHGRTVVKPLLRMTHSCGHSS